MYKCDICVFHSSVEAMAECSEKETISYLDGDGKKRKEGTGIDVGN